MPALHRFWTEFLRPILRRPPRYQVAALCWRMEGEDMRILLLTSRETRRWVIPKGWPKPGLDAAATAAAEAWEEGGVRLRGRGRPVGRYRYAKRMRGVPVGTEVDVFAFPVAAIADDFPEVRQRDRVWLSPEEAAARVEEPDLARILADARQRVRAAPAPAPRPPGTAP